MDAFWLAAATLFGLAVGSFLNVVINRLKIGKTLGGRSECPRCHHELGAHDLVPVLSFALLRGRCRYCRKAISWQYPAVELGTALTFLLIASRYEMGPEAFFVGVLASFFIVIAVYDFKHYLILDKVLVPAFAVALAYAVYLDLSGDCQLGLNLGCATVTGGLGMLIIAGFFSLQYLVSKGKWIGFGDVKFGLVLGMAVGFPLAVFQLFLGYMLGAVAGVAMIAVGRKAMGSRMPFGTYLALAAIITLLYGQGILDWYLELIGF